jgi:hypothetical protein
MLTTRSCGRRNRESRPGVPLVWWRGSNRRIPQPDLNCQTRRRKRRGKVTPPPLSPSRETFPPYSDIVSRQVGITVSELQPKRTQIGIGLSAGLPQQPHLTLVSPNSGGTCLVPMLMNSTHLPVACRSHEDGT